MLERDGFHEDKFSLVLWSSGTHINALKSDAQSDKIDGAGKIYDAI